MPKYEIAFTRTVHQHHSAVIEADSESAARQAFVDGVDTVFEEDVSDDSEPWFTKVADDTVLTEDLPIKTERLYLAAIDHKHGTNLYADPTEAGLYAKLAQFCRDWAEHEQVDISACKTDREVVETYFHEGAEEWVCYGHEDLPV